MDQNRNLATTIGKVHVDVTEIGFGSLSWIMAKGDERFPLAPTPLGHVTPHLVVPTKISIFRR